MELQITSEPGPGTVAVRVCLRLTAREIGKVFVSGDELIQLPTSGMVADSGGSPVPRAGIFLSELAEASDGFVRSFADKATAEAYAASVREQLDAMEARVSGSDRR